MRAGTVVSAWVMCGWLLLAVLGAPLGCSEGPDAVPARSGSDWELNCTRGGLRGHCQSVEVWEDRAAQGGRRLSLRVFILPAHSANPAPDPVFFLAGGPGQGAVQVATQIAAVLERARRSRDLVFVDQRGTGGSNPLACELGSDDDLAEQFRVDFPAERLKACLDGYDADPRLYTTPVAMDDLDEVRAELGYSRVNLVGASYGTRAALVYARRHPDRVRSLVLDGVAPTTMRLFLDFLPDGQRALDLLFTHCEQDPNCLGRFPRLRKDLAVLTARLQANPAVVDLEHPRTGKMVSLSIGADAFLSSLRGFLYSAELSQLVPLMVQQALDGEFRVFVTQALLLGEGVQKSMSLGLLLSVACTEDVPRIKNGERDAAARESFLPLSVVSEIQDACALWPKGTLPPGYHEPVKSDVPTLILSGELDPVTPPRWGAAVAATLARSRHLVVSGVGHGTLGRGCVPRLVAAHLEGLAPELLDASCLEPLGRPPFFLDLFGPAH